MLLQSLDTLRCPTTVGQDELNVVFLLGTGPGPECQGHSGLSVKDTQDTRTRTRILNFSLRTP